MKTDSKNHIVLISTFVIFVMEATITFVIGKRSNDPHAEWSLDLLPKLSDMVHIMMVVGVFAFINHVVVKHLQS